ncbi:unnamed protein product [Amoebophrya sp. A25]|nr:unnamed protein product [Amoebophrya sp. A25]|eukprot:GSA25T00004292001.1
MTSSKARGGMEESGDAFESCDERPELVLPEQSSSPADGSTQKRAFENGGEHSKKSAQNTNYTAEGAKKNRNIRANDVGKGDNYDEDASSIRNKTKLSPERAEGSPQTTGTIESGTSGSEKQSACAEPAVTGEDEKGEADAAGVDLPVPATSGAREDDGQEDEQQGNIPLDEALTTADVALPASSVQGENSPVASDKAEISYDDIEDTRSKSDLVHGQEELDETKHANHVDRSLDDIDLKDHVSFPEDQLLDEIDLRDHVSSETDEEFLRRHEDLMLEEEPGGEKMKQHQEQHQHHLYTTRTRKDHVAAEPERSSVGYIKRTEEEEEEEEAPLEDEGGVDVVIAAGASRDDTEQQGDELTAGASVARKEQGREGDDIIKRSPGEEAKSEAAIIEGDVYLPLPATSPGILDGHQRNSSNLPLSRDPVSTLQAPNVSEEVLPERVGTYDESGSEPSSPGLTSLDSFLNDGSMAALRRAGGSTGSLISTGETTGRRKRKSAIVGCLGGELRTSASSPLSSEKTVLGGTFASVTNLTGLPTAPVKKIVVPFVAEADEDETSWSSSLEEVGGANRSSTTANIASKMMATSQHVLDLTEHLRPDGQSPDSEEHDRSFFSSPSTQLFGRGNYDEASKNKKHPSRIQPSHPLNGGGSSVFSPGTRFPGDVYSDRGGGGARKNTLRRDFDDQHEEEEVDTGLSGVLSAQSSTTGPQQDVVDVFGSQTEERRLQSGVPRLLEEMNVASRRVNEHEREAAERKKKHAALLTSWKATYRNMRSLRGRDIDTARPFFEQEERKQRLASEMQASLLQFTDAQSAADEAKIALREVEERLHFGAHEVRLDAGDQEELSRASLAVMECTAARDRAEKAYGAILRRFMTAAELLDSLRAQIGPWLVDDVRPLFRQMVYYQESLSSLDVDAAEAEARAHQARLDYQGALRALESINEQIHALRSTPSSSSSTPTTNAEGGSSSTMDNLIPGAARSPHRGSNDVSLIERAPRGLPPPQALSSGHDYKAPQNSGAGLKEKFVESSSTGSRSNVGSPSLPLLSGSSSPSSTSMRERVRPPPGKEVAGSPDYDGGGHDADPLVVDFSTSTTSVRASESVPTSLFLSSNSHNYDFRRPFRPDRTDIGDGL